MRHGTLDGCLQCTCLVVAVDKNHHLLGIHHRANTYCQRQLRHLVDVALKETAVGNDGVRGECLHASTTGQRTVRLVEGNVSVGADAAYEQVDAASLLNHLLIVGTLGGQVLGIAVEDVDVLLGAVDVVKQVASHEGVVALRVLLRQPHIFVHIECQHILERYAALLVGLYQAGIHSFG